MTRLGLGCSRIGSISNDQSANAARDLIAFAIDMGVSVVDTADIYGQGDSERQIGRALATRRDRAFIVTKAGKTVTGAARWLAPFKPVLLPLISKLKRRSHVTARREHYVRSNFSPEYLRRALEASLKRLRVEYVDGFLLHSPPLEVLRDERIWRLFDDLIRTGRTRHVGVSIDTADLVDAALEIPHASLLQMPLSVIDVADTASQRARIGHLGIKVMAREIIRSQASMSPTDAVRSALSRPSVTTVLVGTTSRKHLEELIHAGRNAEPPDQRGA
jgi:aryl-alcohol dehydrogenase-like predicted oxidoreductase